MDGHVQENLMYGKKRQVSRAETEAMASAKRNVMYG